MLKSSTLNHTSVTNSIKSWRATLWILLAILLPSAICLLLFLFEAEVADILMDLVRPSIRQGESYFTDFVFLGRVEILFVGLFSLLALVLFFLTSESSLARVFSIRDRTKSLYIMMLIASFACLTTIWIARVALEEFPNSSDEYAYLFQAEMFSRGKWWERAHDLPDFFYINNITQHEGILVSRFPPGWPLVLSAAFKVGMSPTLVNPVLGVASLVALYFFTRRFYGVNVAVWTLVIVAVNGYFLFTSASFFSHVTCFLCALGFVYCLYVYKETRAIHTAILAGLFISFAAVVRYYTALLIALPFLVYVFLELRGRSAVLFAWMALGAAPCLGYLLYYNYTITGNAFLPVTVWAYPDERLGFVKGHTFLTGMDHLVRRTLMFLYWVSPGMLLLYVVFLWKKVKNRVERIGHPEDYAFIMLVVGYFFYYQIGGNQYGPRFMFEAFPFMAIFVVRKAFESRAKWVLAVLLASAIYPVAKLPFIVYRESKIVDQRQDLYNLTKTQRIHNAVVFIESPTSPLRPMPADDLTRNDPKFSNDVVYALPVPGINQLLMDYYADRAFYRYTRDLDDPHGRLIRIR